ncbi:transglycosylase [Staphylococcus arlettae]|uniref:transglycosylase family protein n=1 Tax=Staphylococcus TaxID=1279 RepID=UPI000D1AFC1D|nr:MULTISPECIES: transglycosylase family protein [Staphylococcus]MCD8838698.1 transglycosylase family protein [Staphylococcus arlettae]MCD8849583.1 transglycosylase family protein [Staphylococcus arlettae]MCD8866232.1 transglycosylase family protein [Staphylococcus arlettae]MCD8907551.1 transglycosylase family protein [Staphylococcus arlettae]PTH47022.1 transglycosylase [Staphylococcus arlettae]
MKKTVIASTLAVGLGVTGLASGQADAAEQDINKEQLAQLAQSGSAQLDAAPIAEGAYNYNFTVDGVNYSFQSDGKSFSWSYGEGSGEKSSDASSQSSSEQSAPAEASVAAEQPQQESAPQQTEATTTTSTSTTTTTTSTEASSGSSVNVNSHLQQIAQRESGGDITAINPSSGAAGKYQFLQSTWDSVAPAEYVGQSPASAPESVQDAAAVELYNTAGASQWVTA